MHTHTHHMHVNLPQIFHFLFNLLFCTSYPLSFFPITINSIGCDRIQIYNNYFLPFLNASPFLNQSTLNEKLQHRATQIEKVQSKTNTRTA